MTESKKEVEEYVPKKCKNFEECGNYVTCGSWCKECYYEFHESREELGE